MAIQAAPSAQRAVEVIELLAEHPGEVLPVSEIARRLDQSRATCIAVLLALAASEWVHRHDDGGYSLGTGLVKVGLAAQRGTGFVELLRTSAAELWGTTGHEATASVPSGQDFVIVARSGPDHVMGTGMVVGQVFPLVPPYGLAYAAWSDAALERWLDRAPGLGAGGRRRLRKAAGLVRQLGYSVILDPLSRKALMDAPTGSDPRRRSEVAGLLEQDELVSIDVVGEPSYFSYVSAPVIGVDDEVVALFGLLLRSSHPEELPDLAVAVCDAGRRVSRQLRGGDAVDPGVEGVSA